KKVTRSCWASPQASLRACGVLTRGVRKASTRGLPAFKTPLPLQQRHNLRLRRAARDVHAAILVHEHIHLAAHAELRQVDTRLDGEAGARQDAAIFARLQAVHVGAVAVRLLADRVAGAVAEVLAVAGLLDDVAGSLVHLPSVQRLAGGKGAL